MHPLAVDDVSHCLNAGGMGRQDWETESFVASTLRSDHSISGNTDSVITVSGASDPISSIGVAQPVTGRNGDPGIVGVTIHGTDKTQKVASYTNACGSLRTKPPGSQENSSTTAIQHGMRVRRLTPMECERLQGFPDGYTQVTYRKKPAKDGPRYKAIGNSMAVNVMSWIGHQIMKS